LRGSGVGMSCGRAGSLRSAPLSLPLSKVFILPRVQAQLSCFEIGG
jgi:hypothetical protein